MGGMKTVLYVAACLVIPFLWGVLVHWAFQQVDRLAARRRGRRGDSAPASTARERAPSMWDYQI
jgi:hypothetical protein